MTPDSRCAYVYKNGSVCGQSRAVIIHSDEGCECHRFVDSQEPEGEKVEELKRCPFCGGEGAFNTVTYSGTSDEVQMNGQTVFWGVNCIGVNCIGPNCGAHMRGIIGYRTRSAAAAAWNRRAPETANVLTNVAMSAIRPLLEGGSNK